MDQFQKVLDTILDVIASFKTFFAELVALFKPATEGGDETTGV